MRLGAPVTNQVFDAYLQCKMKAYLLTRPPQCEENEFWSHQQRLTQAHKQAGIDRLMADIPACETLEGTPSLFELRQQRPRLIIGATIDTPSLRANIHAMRRASAETDGASLEFCPIRFTITSKIKRADKLAVAYDALLISIFTDYEPITATIVHGPEYTEASVRTTKLIQEVRSICAEILAQLKSDAPPVLALNRHCPECQFLAHCRKAAVESDNLTLIATLSETERAKLNKKGITTVSQLSLLYRPRRRSKRSAQEPEKHDVALKALAIREHRIHVVNTPALTLDSNALYLDIEGIPDLDFYYLIGLRFRSADQDVYKYFWAEKSSDEREIWASFLKFVAPIQTLQLVHYGSYEKQFLKRMKTRYCNAADDIAVVDRLIASSINLLDFTYSRVYFPTYTNGLKEIANYLGFRWSNAASSGLHALMWRSWWETSKDPHIMSKLITYNAEDCEATQRVAEALTIICSPRTENTKTELDPVYTRFLVERHKRLFRPLDSAIPEFLRINEASYWDYQTTKIYVRSSDNIRKAVLKSQREKSKRASYPNKVLFRDDLRPEKCLRCGSEAIHKYQRHTEVTLDIVFSASGARRRVVQTDYYVYRCWECLRYFKPYERRAKHLNGLCAYIIYMIIEIGVSQHKLCSHLRDVFRLILDRRDVNRIKVSASERYKITYENLQRKISGGRLVQADETRVSVAGVSHYVWVFTSLEEVIYVYSATRSAETAQKVLSGFHGVLVSDFYAGYDSIDCVQQKCLIHLMRDINDDVLKEPFNQEMKELAHAFGTLLKRIIDTIDRFGLKSYHLRKHKKDVDQFFAQNSERRYKTTIAHSYSRRFERYRSSLFSFIDYDDVPWNNNNAEHAVKAFVRLRNVIGGLSTPKGVGEYLVLLSIYETCKFRKVGFLDFLRSGLTDITEFSACQRRRETALPLPAR